MALKKCPHCGSKAQPVKREVCWDCGVGGKQILCTECGAQTEYFAPIAEDEEISEAWNRRV